MKNRNSILPCIAVLMSLLVSVSGIKAQENKPWMGQTVPSPTAPPANNKLAGPQVRFVVTSKWLKTEGGDNDNNPVGYSYYQNDIKLEYWNPELQKIIEVSSYECTLHGAGECGEVSDSDFEPERLKLPASIASKRIAASVIVGSEIERAWNRYDRYVCILENGRLIVYSYAITSFDSEVNYSSLNKLLDVVI